MSRCGCALLAVLLLGGCEQGQPPRPGASEPETGSALGPLDPLSRRFGRVRRRMRERGFRERHRLGRQFAVEGEGVALPMDLPTQVCTTFVALAGGGMRDLRTTLYDGNGDQAATDSVSGEGGLVHVCPPASGGEPATAPYYLVLEAVKGSGAIVGAEFESMPGDSKGFADLFSGVLAPRVPLRDVEEQLEQSRSTLEARGHVLMEEPRLERVAEGEVLRSSYLMEAGRCYAAIARGGEGVEDVDLFLYDPSGAEVARDLEGDAEPALEHCPAQTGRHILEVRAFEGSGALGSMMLKGGRDERDAPGRGPSAAAPDAAIAAPRDEASPTEVLGNEVSRLAARGYQSAFVVRDVSITPGEVRTHDVRLGPGCGVVVGAGAPGMDLDLYLSSASGRPIDRDTRVEPTARVSACASQSSVRRVAVKAYGKRGPYALAVMRAPAHIDDMQTLRLDEAAASFRRRGYQPGATVRTGLEQGERWVGPFEALPGQCVGIAAAGDASISDVDVFLRDVEGELVASATGPAPWGAVARCADEGGPLSLRLQVVLYRGEGEVAIMRLVRGEAVAAQNAVDAAVGEGRDAHRASAAGTGEDGPPPQGEARSEEAAGAATGSVAP